MNTTALTPMGSWSDWLAGLTPHQLVRLAATGRHRAPEQPGGIRRSLPVLDLGDPDAWPALRDRHPDVDAAITAIRELPPAELQATCAGADVCLRARRATNDHAVVVRMIADEGAPAVVAICCDRHGEPSALARMRVPKPSGPAARFVRSVKRRAQELTESPRREMS